MNGCVFLDDHGRRCRRSAQAGDVFCPPHRRAGHPVPFEPDSEPIEFSFWHRLLRRLVASALLAFFLLQTYVMILELLR